MKSGKELPRKKKTFKTVKANVKDLELVRKNQLHIAKKATELFIKKGFHKTSIRDISRATGMAIGVLYGYIKRKEDVLSLVFELYHNIWNEYLERNGVFEIEDPEEQLRTALYRVMELDRDWKEAVLLMYRESKFLPKQALREAMDEESKFIACFEGMIRRGVEKKVFKVKDPFFAANMLIYEITINPLRGWNLKRYTDEERIALIVDHAMTAILR